jgi:hypothetical protein
VRGRTDAGERRLRHEELQILGMLAGVIRVK